MHASPAQVVELPTPPSADHPTTYDLFVSGDYEVRVYTTFYTRDLSLTFLDQAVRRPRCTRIRSPRNSD